MRHQLSTSASAKGLCLSLTRVLLIIEKPALTGVAQLVGLHSTKQKVASSILLRAHAWVVDLSLGQSMYERELINVSHIDVSLPLFLPPFSSL